MKEKWEEIYTKQQLDDIQSIEKEILKEFIKVCQKLDIEYFIYGGTLLGTIKYGKMIPWDDDIDVAMTRDNYIRFLNEASAVLSSKFVIQSPYNEKKSPFPYTKLRKKGTKFIEEFNHKLDIEKGIYIDIYPVDNIPDDEKLRMKQYKKVDLYRKLYYHRQCLHAAFPFPISKFKIYFFRLILHYSTRILPQTFYINKIDKFMTKYNSVKTKRKACLFSPNYDNIYIKLYPLIKKNFEDIDVMVPNCYNDHLKKRYGDYMKDIPAYKRIGHIPYEFETHSIESIAEEK